MSKRMWIPSDDNPKNKLVVLLDDQGDIWIDMIEAGEIVTSGVRLCTNNGGGQNPLITLELNKVFKGIEHIRNGKITQ